MGDPVTGEELGQTAKGKLRKVRVNNRLRATIRGAIGALSLFSLDPDAPAGPLPAHVRGLRRRHHRRVRRGHGRAREISADRGSNGRAFDVTR